LEIRHHRKTELGIETTIISKIVHFI
jgi:hypothetical protein